MKKLLISWYAYNHDFAWMGEGKNAKKKREISEDSPTLSVHRHFWNDYEKHLLLYSDKNENEIRYYDFLYSEISKEFRNHLIEKKYIEIDDVINVNEILLKVNKLLSTYTEYQVDIFVNPGTPQMQVAWYFAASNFKNIKLFQIRPAKYSKDKNKPDKIDIQLNKSALPTNLNIASSINTKYGVDDKYIISKSLKNIYQKALSIAQTDDVTCLILGENGTGKENLASFIHNNSERKNKPFKKINCAAFNDELLASELFGHKKGSFTGAYENKIGILEEANGGTVFLDEIGDISPKMQVSLLRVLQEKEIKPLGSNNSIKINVRIITATNRNLVELAKKDAFRWDLFFRLSVAELKLPRLIERGNNEIKELLYHFIKIYQKKFTNRKHTLKLTTEAEELILNYNFPGNVRELENLVITLYTFCENEVNPNDLPDKIHKPFSDDSIKLEDIKKQHILNTLKLFNNNINLTANKLGITRNSLKQNLRKYGVL